ncbi:unnamed protein product [Agarophyton chilense]
MPDISLDSFSYRQFDDPKYGGTKIKLPKEQFMKKVLAYYDERKAMQNEYKDRPVLVDGYAPFCKHIFMPNFDNSIRDGAMEITSENEHLLKTAYEARNEKELPVLIRFFPGDKVSPPVSKFLDLILYSREQIQKENLVMGKSDAVDDAPWRLISVKGQAEPFEIPMNPITIMRNELISQGGSGVPINRDAYMKSVEYWRTHAAVH